MDNEVGLKTKIPDVFLFNQIERIAKEINYICNVPFISYFIF